MLNDNVLTFIAVLLLFYQQVDSKPMPGDKATMSGEPTHFQVDDRAAEIEVNANAAGTKVIAKPASLQVVAKPGAPAIPVTHPMVHLAPHFAHLPLPIIHHQPAQFYHGGGLFGMNEGLGYYGKKKHTIPKKEEITLNSKTLRKSVVPEPTNSTLTKHGKGGSKRQFINSAYGDGMDMTQPVLGTMNNPSVPESSEMMKDFGSSLDNPVVDPHMLGIEAPVTSTRNYRPVTSFETSGPQSTTPNFTPPLVSMGNDVDESSQVPQARSFLPTGNMPLYSSYPGLGFTHPRMRVPHYHRRHLRMPYPSLSTVPSYPGVGYAGSSGIGGYGDFSGVPGMSSYPSAVARLPLARSFMPQYVPRYVPRFVSRYMPLFLPHYTPVPRSLARVPRYRNVRARSRNMVPTMMVPQYAIQPVVPAMPQAALPNMYAPVMPSSMYPYATKRGAVPKGKLGNMRKVGQGEQVQAKEKDGDNLKSVKLSAKETNLLARGKDAKISEERKDSIPRKTSEGSEIYKRNNIIGVPEIFLPGKLINKLQPPNKAGSTKRQIIMSPQLGAGNPLQGGMMLHNPGPMFHSFPYLSKFGATQSPMLTGLGGAISPEMGPSFNSFNGGMGGDLNPALAEQGLSTGPINGLNGNIGATGFIPSGLAVRGLRTAGLRSRLRTPMGFARAVSLFRHVRPNSFLPLRASLHQRPLSRSNLYSLGSMRRLPMLGMRRGYHVRRPWGSSFVSPSLYRRRLEKQYETNDDDDDDDDVDYDLRGNVPGYRVVNGDTQTRNLEQNIGIPISVEAKTAAGMLKQRLMGVDDEKRSFITRPSENKDTVDKSKKIKKN